MALWTSPELKRLRGLYDKKPAWVTDYQFSANVSKELKRTPESIRWQVRQWQRDVKVESPKILLLDIETLPLEGRFWGTRKQFISPVQITKDWSVLCWSAKWLFDSKHYGRTVSPKEAINRQDASILGDIWTMMNEADVIVTQNGDNFDFKKLNTRFFLNGFPKPMFYKSVDTYKIFTDNFSFTYNKLDWVGDLLGVGRKLPTSFQWWNECAEGNKKYLDKMLEYNMHDVDLLEEVYLKVRPWVKNHPNLGLFTIEKGVNVCGVCTSSELKWEGKYQTALGLYMGCRCQKCGAIGRSTRKEFKLASAKMQ